MVCEKNSYLNRMGYLVTVPFFIRKLFGDVVWQMPGKEKVVYLTFDDGPHPTETPFVLDELKKQNAKGTFFCIGRNASSFPEIYNRILEEGHTVGNHSYSHLNGWKHSATDYMKDVITASEVIDSKIFRPPYGRIRRQQIKELQRYGYQTIMWTAISADFDRSITSEKCVSNVMSNVRPGAIIVFHDSEKASANLRYALPIVLKQLSELGYRCQSIPTPYVGSVRE